ncbi:hypothetical protein ACF9IK_31395 [Kitasatospora hibisci]|uniref:hypothetical protein n=1 Tax=Kitasatospora hibisci TaxID=3369522 RepID=UPI003754CED1
MSGESTVFWRGLTLVAALIGAASGALFFWSWGSPLAVLPVLPLWITGAAGLAVAVAASLGIRDGDGTPMATVGTALLTLTLWIGAATADLSVTGIRDWVRTPQAITATLTECRLDGSFHGPDTLGSEHHSCVHHWTFRGEPRSERRGVADSRPDGHRQEMWMSPSTGEIADHPLLALVGYSAATLAAGAIVAAGGWSRLRTEARRLRRAR